MKKGDSLEEQKVPEWVVSFILNGLWLRGRRRRDVIRFGPYLSWSEPVEETHH